MHGGIGTTAEHAIGHYARRLLAIEHTFGSTDEQLRLLTAQIRSYDLIEIGLPTARREGDTEVQPIRDGHSS